MKRLLVGLILVVTAALAAAGAWLWTPTPPAFNAEAAIAAARGYDARIIRDRWGVPHIYGARDADAAFGLAYAHAEDDWKTIEEMIFFSRGALASRNGKDAAVTDYLVAALGANDAIARDYETVLSPDTRAMLDGYVAGINFYCAEEKRRCSPGAAPVRAQDIVAGFTGRTPFFYGLENTLKNLFEKDTETHAGLEWTRQAFLRVTPESELGSNAIAVAPQRSADGATRLMVNSHQPYVGPVAWYEARIKSGEGWDMIGGIFPGTPLILHGATPELGWAFTVNQPDLVDVYALQTDREKKPRKYRFDGGWKDFERGTARFRVKLWGPFSLPVNRATYRTVHGPAFETPNGWRAVAYAGDGDIRAVEQWRRMNKAANYDDWRAAMAMQAIPSFNVIYADRSGRVGYIYNMAVPDRSADWDWSTAAPGERADLVWRGVLPFGTSPQVIAPPSGLVLNANNEPWKASTADDSPKAEDYPAHLGILSNSTNRGLREQELYGIDTSITSDEFIAYKMDDAYSQSSELRTLIAATIADPEIGAEASLAPALAILAAWDGRTNRDNRAAALGVTFGRYALGFLLNHDEAPTPDPKTALAKAVADLTAGFGRIDPPWGDVNRLKRGAVNLALDGGPDTLRAVYSQSDIAKGEAEAVGGDTYVMLVEWTADGSQSIRTIHQFGAATLDASSPHYADQAPLFAAKQFKQPPMTLEPLLAEATRDYRPGREKQP
ncbi:MAG: penicillin acylase family protein [Parvularculaceae bacterium]